ncbi:MAG: Lrp/AsnC family transcriptional regulator [Planctomycetaceae bacterium]|nr:MAG: Lrp/AsnC family transcriptional regulator [Planctomycetaceae bacterium]
MDETDKKILNIIQTDFPVHAEPFNVLAKIIGIDEDEVLKRVKKLKETGIIRRMGAVFDTRKLGFASTLCAARVSKEKLKEFVEIVNSYPGVTHNYRRNHEYNVWFTFMASTEEEIKKTLIEISEKTGINDIFNMPAKRNFKIDVSFDF